MTYDGYVRETFTAIPPGRTDCPGCAALRAEVVRAEMAQQEQLLDALAERTAERDRYRRALEEIAQDCDCERRGCGEGAHWASCSTLCGSAPARARKALEVAP